MGVEDQINWRKSWKSKSGLDAGFRVVKPDIQPPSLIILNNVVLNNVLKKVKNNNVPLT